MTPAFCWATTMPVPSCEAQAEWPGMAPLHVRHEGADQSHQGGRRLVIHGVTD